MKKLEMLISDGLNVNCSFQLFPLGWSGMEEAYLTCFWDHWSRCGDSSHRPPYKIFRFLKVFRSKVIFSCWLAFSLGHHESRIERRLESFTYLFLWKMWGKPGLGTCARLLSRTHPGTCSTPPPFSSSSSPLQHADLLSLHALDAAAAGGAGSPDRASLFIQVA